MCSRIRDFLKLIESGLVTPQTGSVFVKCLWTVFAIGPIHDLLFMALGRQFGERAKWLMIEMKEVLCTFNSSASSSPYETDAIHPCLEAADRNSRK